jgi:uncharacterized protein
MNRIPVSTPVTTAHIGILDTGSVIDEHAIKQEYVFKTNYPELEPIYNFKNKELTANKTKINFVVTHGGCSDGFMSATIVRKWLQEQTVNPDNGPDPVPVPVPIPILDVPGANNTDQKDTNEVIFYNAYYGNDFSALPEMMRDKYVLICDFSFSKPLFDQMIATTNGNILVLDHHKTAQKNLQAVPEKYLTFDMKHSGAFLAWVYMYGFTNIPKAVLYVEDNDIWTKQLPDTKEFTAFMFSRKFDFDEYDKFFCDQYLDDVVFPVGSGMVLQNDYYIEQLAKKTVPHFIEINNRYYFVACLNSAGLLRSELGNSVLVKNFPNANFSMIYAHDQYNTGTSISYRSLDDRTDSTVIAKLNGGGGHRNASAAKVSVIVTSPPCGRLIDRHRAYWLLDKLYRVEQMGMKFLILNSPNMHKHISTYLMQERFFDDEAVTRNEQRTKLCLPGYQEGMFCMRTRIQNNELDEYYHGAIIWNYDGHCKKYTMTIKMLPGLVKHVKENIDKFNQTFITIDDKINVKQAVDNCMVVEYKEYKNDIIYIKFMDNHTIEKILGICISPGFLAGVPGVPDS